ncbi:MAG: translocation/assembly module TamB domain-containing protein [Terracidiphilus sp.]
MSEPESTLSVPKEPLSPSTPSRLRRFFLRHLPLAVVCAAVLLTVAAIGLYFWGSSAGFEGLVRKRLIARLETATGGRVEIASFHWHLLDLEAEAGGLVIHGLEAPGEAPYARIEHLRVRFSVLGFWSPRILLRDLDVSQPGFHLIVYPDGSTNQPHPRKPRKPGKSALNTFFDFKAGHISVEQGVLDYESRAASFDFQDRFIPLDFDADDVSLLVSYVPAGSENNESYRIQAGAADLNLLRGRSQRAHGYMQATLDLTRSAAYLRSMRITSKAHAAKNQKASDHILEISGTLEDFAHPRWQAKAAGDLDMELLDPIFGYPFAPEGIARLDLTGAGEAGEFRADGSVHVDGGSYIGTGVVATGVGLDAHVHADPGQLLISSIVARLRQGGQIEGEVDLKRWLPILPGTATMQPASASPGKAHSARNQPAIRAASSQPPADITIPVNGRVVAKFNDVALDTILEMVCDPPFQHLGLDTRITGPAIATWIDGDNRTVAVDAHLDLAAPEQIAANKLGAPGDRSSSLGWNKVAASGLIDATYTQRDGAVDLRRLELHTPASELEAHGHLGAYPLTSPSALAVDFHTRNLNEFDTVLRDLGLNRNGKSGTAALPVTLAGQLDFLHGMWTGSLVNPRIAGNLKATQLSVELLPFQPTQNDKKLQPQTLRQRFVRWDSVESAGSYAAERIVIEHGVLRKGKAEIALEGSLDAAPSRGLAPAFDANSILHMHLRAGKVGLDDLLTLAGQNLPLTGMLDAQLQLDGPVHTLGGSGWVELDGGSVYGEPIARFRAQGTVANQVIKLDSVSVSDAAGKIAATGSFDLKSRRFQLDAHGSGIDVARIEWLRNQGLETTGKLEFSVTGSGTLDDPRLEGRAMLSTLTVSGEPLGDLEVVAHTAARSVTYDVTTGLEGTELNLHGQTALNGDYATHARLEFSRFNIGALLKMAHVESISGESSLAGTVTVEGPLARPEQLRGEASLQQLAVTVAGVHLESRDGLHATLDNARINLDPLHVTGENTDLRAQGSLALKDKQQLDFAASGSINLKLAQTLDPDLTASGTTTFQVEAHGPLKNPGLQGRIDFQNGSLSLEDIPNGLSQLHGALEFNQNRLEVRSLTAMSGGGLLSVTGYLAYQHGIYADLSVTGKGIRIRYPQGVSSLADATLHLQGSQTNLLLSGDVLITRFSVSPDLDIAALAAQANAVQTFAPPDAPSNHIRLDVHLVSSPQLNFQNAYAKLAGDVDLRLRGTVASPSLLGRVSITEGSATIAGTRYDLQRGDIFFTNPVRIEPSIDLNATARVEDYEITLGLHGTPQKLAVAYRSDPPLPEADVVALLALGRTENQQRLYTQQQEQSLANPTTDALLGGALNASVSSRVQKLFGTGSVKVDPNYLGVMGNSTSRIIVEEPLGRNITLTYATDVDTPGQQLLQAEIAINRHVSLLVVRDESGVFSMVLKATRRFR